MAFTTQRGRPRKTPPPTIDFGTPELRLKHALRLTSEPIDICLEKAIITETQHWCGLHLRWLYTLRYGAPSLTTHYSDREYGSSTLPQDPTWRTMREKEYHEAVQQLIKQRRYEPVMRLTVFNETPAFLNQRLIQRSWELPALAEKLATQNHQLREGLDLLVSLWRSSKQSAVRPSP